MYPHRRKYAGGVIMNRAGRVAVSLFHKLDQFPEVPGAKANLTLFLIPLRKGRFV
jgi:hypothetical protein